MIEESSLGAQCPLVAKTELTWNCRRGKVCRIAMDLKSVDMQDLERHPDQRGGGFRYEPLVDVILVDPVADLQFAFPKARVQTCPADQPGVLWVEDAIDEVLPEIEQAAKPFESLYFLLDRFRL